MSDFNTEVIRELECARRRHAPMNSPHEALAVIEEEVAEFRTHVYRKL